MRLLLDDGSPPAGAAPPPPPALTNSGNNGAFIASKAVLYLSIVAVVLAWCIACWCFLRHCARQRRRRQREQAGGEGGAGDSGTAAATAAYPLPHALPVLIINPDNSTFELGIKEVDPCALADEADWPGPPGGRAHPLKALRVPAPSAAGGAMHAAEADTDGGSPLSVLARQRGYQGFGGGPVGGWPPRPHLHHVQLAQAGVWLPQDADEEATGAHEQAEPDGSADSSADGSSDGSAGSHDVDASAGPHTAADSRG